MKKLSVRAFICQTSMRLYLGLFSELKKKRNYQKRLGMFSQYGCRIKEHTFGGREGGEDLGGMEKGKLLKYIV